MIELRSAFHSQGKVYRIYQMPSGLLELAEMVTDAYGNTIGVQAVAHTVFYKSLSSASGEARWLNLTDKRGWLLTSRGMVRAEQDMDHRDLPWRIHAYVTQQVMSAADPAFKVAALVPVSAGSAESNDVICSFLAAFIGAPL